MRVLPLLIFLASSPPVVGVSAGTVGPVTPCPEELQLLEPVGKQTELPTHWSFWSECDTFVGTPIVEYVVTPGGRTSDHRMIRSSGCEEADRELLCWLRKWTYRPARCGDEPIAWRTTFIINWHPGSGEGAAEHCLPEGKLLEWSSSNAATVSEACHQATQKTVRFTVHLAENGQASQVDIKLSSGVQECDQALVKLLSAAVWRPCEELGLDPPCSIGYSVPLPWEPDQDEPDG